MLSYHDFCQSSNVVFLILSVIKPDPPTDEKAWMFAVTIFHVIMHFFKNIHAYCGSIFSSVYVQITGDAEAIKRALTTVSAIMYKFSPKEEIPLDSSVPDLPHILIPSDVPIIPAGSLYPTADTILPPGSLPQVIAATHQASEIPGFIDASNVWPMYPSTLPVVPGYGGPARSEDLVLRVLCPFDKVGRVIGKQGNTIKSIRQSSGAKINVDDTRDDTDECTITITSKEVRTVLLFSWFSWLWLIVIYCM